MNFNENNTEQFTNFPDQDLFEPEEISEPTVKDYFFKLLRAIVVLVVLLGLLNLSGVYQYFIYQRTPAVVTQESTLPLLEAEEIRIPLTIFIIRNDETLGSGRSPSDVERLVKNADIIWDQATINLEAVEIIELALSDNNITLLLSGTQESFTNIPGYDPSTINAFLVKSLSGINGLAFGGASAIFVADFTTVIDFRTFAHEIGHILGLGHVGQDRGRLMYRGANGFDLTLDEVVATRERALQF